MDNLSKAQINKLGERLKGEVTEQDLRLLDKFRQSFADSYQEVVEKISNELGLAPTGRLDKSNASILAKLRREGTRLTTMQDIAGCRIVVDNIESQDSVVEAISKLFSTIAIVDRRAEPRHGYRAVHLIVKSTPRTVEVQVRTILQHLWAELSEKLADKWGHGLKYGSGDQSTLETLYSFSWLIKRYEDRERQASDKRSTLTDISNRANLDWQSAETIKKSQQELEIFERENQAYKGDIFKALQDAKDI
jgi:putative GTP pyrophosphokinase